MNRFFVSFAAITASGVFAFSYWNEWINHSLFNKELVLKPSELIEYPYFHQSESLYLKVILIFGIYFSLLTILSIIFTFLQKWGWIYMCFILTMLGIMGIMVNGAIK